MNRIQLAEDHAAGKHDAEPLDECYACRMTATLPAEEDDEYGMDGLPLSGRPLDGDGR